MIIKLCLKYPHFKDCLSHLQMTEKPGCLCRRLGCWSIKVLSLILGQILWFLKTCKQTFYVFIKHMVMVLSRMNTTVCRKDISNEFWSNRNHFINFHYYMYLLSLKINRQQEQILGLLLNNQYLDGSYSARSVTFYVSHFTEYLSLLEMHFKSRART